MHGGDDVAARGFLLFYDFFSIFLIHSKWFSASKGMDKTSISTGWGPSI